MKKLPLFLLGLTLLLSGCVAPMAPSIPPDYTGPRAVLRDSALTHSTSKVDFFVVVKLAGKEIKNSRSESMSANYGKGFNLSPVLLDREVPAGQPLQLEIVARSEYAAPILALTNPVYMVKGEVTFTPAADHTYMVKGVLGADYSAVWIEDTSTQQVVGEKIEAKGSAKLGFWSK